MTQPRALYNEIDPKAAAWLRELIRQGHIAPGDVVEASIEDLTPNDLKPYTQAHFFAGIGVWSYALRKAGWPDDRPVWTGSCPCQPFSAAGKGGGFDDERHLWPAFHWLIEQCRPPVVFGEQVASKDGLAWLDLVQADLEGTGYASGAVDLCAAGVGAPHIRQRLWWVAERLADADGGGRTGASGSCNAQDERVAERSEHHRLVGLEHATGDRRQQRRPEPSRRGIAGGCGDSGLAHGDRDGCKSGSEGLATLGHRPTAQPDRGNGWLADPLRNGAEHGSREGLDAQTAAHGRDGGVSGKRLRPRIEGALGQGQPGPTNGLWRDADWLFCRDGKWRPVEPGTFPLAHGASGRVGRLRGYGNAIVAPAAQAFIEAYLGTGEADRAA